MKHFKLAHCRRSQRICLIDQIHVVQPVGARRFKSYVSELESKVSRGYKALESLCCHRPNFAVSSFLRSACIGATNSCPYRGAARGAGRGPRAAAKRFAVIYVHLLCTRWRFNFEIINNYATYYVYVQ